MTQRDEMTGLLDRRGLEEAVRQTLADRNDDMPLSILAMDIDGFKRINDNHGHKAGDEVIMALVKAMKQIGEKQGVLSRFGGDQFAIAFLQLEREQAFLAAEKIRGLMDQPHPLKSSKKGAIELKLCISGGVAAYPLDGQTCSDILRQADEAQYRAKTTGKNKICIAQDTKMATKTSHYTTTQLERLTRLSEEEGVGEAMLLREALDDLLAKYRVDA